MRPFIYVTWAWVFSLLGVIDYHFPLGVTFMALIIVAHAYYGKW